MCACVCVCVYVCVYGDTLSRNTRKLWQCLAYVRVLHSALHERPFIHSFLSFCVMKGKKKIEKISFTDGLTSHESILRETLYVQL